MLPCFSVMVLCFVFCVMVAYTVQTASVLVSIDDCLICLIAILGDSSFSYTLRGFANLGRAQFIYFSLSFNID